jgi:SAM-dependent methyltransferase
MTGHGGPAGGHPTACDAWRDALGAWAIPAEILAGAEESPWALPVEVFARRVEDALRAPAGPSLDRGAEALPGSVLDVGAGAGAASLPLHRYLTALSAVDTSAAMLDALAARAADLPSAGGGPLPVTRIEGRWPDVADRTPPADLVVCHHVLYNVPDLAPFVAALRSHARRRVVLEITERHPLSGLNPYWKQLHGLDRPDRPTAADALAALAELGVRPHVRHWTRPPAPAHGDADELVESTRRRLCLPRSRRGELLAALRRHGADPDRPRDPGASGDAVVTLWWDEV